jgi:hypothetical protein
LDALTLDLIGQNFFRVSDHSRFLQFGCEIWWGCINFNSRVTLCFARAPLLMAVAPFRGAMPCRAQSEKGQLKG